MPTWRTHLSVGCLLTICLIYASYLSGYWSFFIDGGEIKIFYWFHIIFITLLGSLLPDFDYRKTRIRYGLGPALGGFIIISYFFLYRPDPSTINTSFLVILLILFLILPLIAGLIVPFKHHGFLHSLSAAALYGVSWFAIESLIFDLTNTEAALIAVFGFVSYFSHLLFDLDIKLY